MATNEELAAKLQQNADSSLAEQLWHQVEKFALQTSSKYFSMHEELIKEQRDDFLDVAMQESFLAMLEAVASYNQESSSFITYYGLCLKTAMARAAGIRSQKDYNQKLFESDMLRLDIPLDEDDSDSVSLLDKATDVSAAAAFDAVDDKIYTDKLHQLLDAYMADVLTEEKHQILDSLYFENKSAKQIASDTSIPLKRVYNLQRYALRILNDKLHSSSAGKLLEQYVDARTNFFHIKSMDNVVSYREQLRAALKK